MSLQYCWSTAWNPFQGTLEFLTSSRTTGQFFIWVGHCFVCYAHMHIKIQSKNAEYLKNLKMFALVWVGKVGVLIKLSVTKCDGNRLNKINHDILEAHKCSLMCPLKRQKIAADTFAFWAFGQNFVAHRWKLILPMVSQYTTDLQVAVMHQEHSKNDSLNVFYWVTLNVNLQVPLT